MSLFNENIIQKQVIDLVVNAPVDGFEFQNEVDNLCRFELRNGLEKLLEKYNSLDEVIRIDVLFADVEYSSLKDFETSFAEKILKEVEIVLLKKVSSSLKSADDTTASVANKLVRLLVFYLQNGFLPWWSSVKTSREWQEVLNNLIFQENKPADWTIFYPILKEKKVRIRFLETFNKKQFWLLMQNVSSANIPGFKADFETIHASLKTRKQRQSFESTYKDVLLNSIAEVHSSKLLADLFSELLVQQLKSEQPKLFSNIVPEKIITQPLKDLFVKQIQKTDSEALEAASKEIPSTKVNDSEDKLVVNEAKLYAETDKEEIYISNAGLVIVAAYLPMFFKDLGYISKEAVLDSVKAIAAMQYIVKGVDGYEEFESVLPKILCGLELSKPIVQQKLNKREKQKVNELLESVLEHWAVLKSTSVEGLRISFLQREGRLVFKNNEWNLKVKQEAYDLLLSHLEWNISMIKLPWMKCLLNVEWV